MFCLTIRLWVIRCEDLVRDPILFLKVLEGSVKEVGTPITYDVSRNPKSRQYMSFQELNYDLLIAISISCNFFPFRHIIDGYKDLQIST